MLSEKLVHADLDERALDALKEFPVDGALTVLKQFVDSNLEHVSNKSAYLCGVMKTYRQKSKAQGMLLMWLQMRCNLVKLTRIFCDCFIACII